MGPRIRQLLKHGAHKLFQIWDFVSDNEPKEQPMTTDELMDVLTTLLHDDDDDIKNITSRKYAVAWIQWLMTMDRSEAKLYMHTGILAVLTFKMSMNTHASPVLVFVHTDNTCTEIARRWDNTHYLTAHFVLVDGWKRRILPWQVLHSRSQRKCQLEKSTTDREVATKVNKNKIRQIHNESDEEIVLYCQTQLGCKSDKAHSTQDYFASLPEEILPVIVRLAALHDLRKLWDCPICDPFWYNWTCRYCMSWITYIPWTLEEHYGLCKHEQCGCCRTKRGAVTGCNACESWLNLRATARSIRQLLDSLDSECNTTIDTTAVPGSSRAHTLQPQMTATQRH